MVPTLNEAFLTSGKSVTALSSRYSSVSFYFHSPGFLGSQVKYSMLGLLDIWFQNQVWGKMGDWGSEEVFCHKI